MGFEKHTLSNDFILLELFSFSQTSQVFFSFIFVIFFMAILKNTVMILLIHRNLHLHTSMYILLSHLSFMDILHISNIVPKMFTDFLSGRKTISFAGCGSLVFLSLILLVGECFLLAAMSYDHYVAICHPLYYPILMNQKVSILMLSISWLIGIINSTILTSYILHFPFCGSKAIDHFFCEIPAVLKLSRIDTSHYEWGIIVNGRIFLVIPSSIISASSIQILLIILQMKSSEARKKSFSTCSFHMIVIVMYYGPFIFTYMRPKSYHTTGQDKFLALFSTIFTPTLSPLIYSFRNKDVLLAMKNMLKSNFQHKK